MAENFQKTSQNEQETDVYKILGINDQATQSEIRKAYLNKAKLYHPDKNNGENLEAFQLLNAAYKVLGNSELKEKYDRGELFNNIEQVC